MALYLQSTSRFSVFELEGGSGAAMPPSTALAEISNDDGEWGSDAALGDSAMQVMDREWCLSFCLTRGRVCACAVLHRQWLCARAQRDDPS